MPFPGSPGHGHPFASHAIISSHEACWGQHQAVMLLFCVGRVVRVSRVIEEALGHPAPQDHLASQAYQGTLDPQARYLTPGKPSQQHKPEAQVFRGPVWDRWDQSCCRWELQLLDRRIYSERNPGILALCPSESHQLPFAWLNWETGLSTAGP